MRASAAGKDAQRRQVQHVLGYPKEPHQVWSDDEISDAYARAGGLYGPMQ